MNVTSRRVSMLALQVLHSVAFLAVCQLAVTPGRILGTAVRHCHLTLWVTNSRPIYINP